MPCDRQLPTSHVHPSIIRVEKLWMRDGAAYFFGPIFIRPEETEHEPTKMFYKKEVFLSNLEEACPMTCIIGTVAARGGWWWRRRQSNWKVVGSIQGSPLAKCRGDLEQDNLIPTALDELAVALHG